MKVLSLLSLISVFSVVSTLHAAPAADSPNGGLMLEHDAVEDSSLLSWWGNDLNFYFIQQSEDLVEWTFMPIFEVGDDDVISWGFRSTAPRLFFRTVSTDDPDSALMQSDFDHDGLTVYQEYLLGSNPFNPDTAGDGIFDGIAHKLGLSITPPEPPAPDPMDTTPPTITLASPTSAVLLP